MIYKIPIDEIVKVGPKASKADMEKQWAEYFFDAPSEGEGMTYEDYRQIYKEATGKELPE